MNSSIACLVGTKKDSQKIKKDTFFQPGLMHGSVAHQ